MIAQFVGIVLVLMLAVILAGFVLAHFGAVVLLVLAVVLLGRYLRQHGA